MRWRTQNIRGFYAVLDRPDVGLCQQLCRVAPIVQVRKKPATAAELLAIATIARRVTTWSNRLLVINDDINLADKVEADGVHLGQDDMRLQEARRRTDLMIGISTHSLAQVRTAVKGGADYIAYGPIFPTKTKADPDEVVGLDGHAGLAAAVKLAGEIPVIAIGGVKPENAGAIASAGAVAACAISAVNSSKNPETAARAIASWWR